MTVTQKLLPGGGYRLPSFGVRNPGDEAATYRMAVSTTTGQSGKEPPEEWFRFEPATFTLAPGTTRAVTARIDLPAGAEPGDYEALVGAQLVTDGNGAQVGAAAAAQVSFTVEPSSLLAAYWLELKGFWAVTLRGPGSCRSGSRCSRPLPSRGGGSASASRERLRLKNGSTRCSASARPAGRGRRDGDPGGRTAWGAWRLWRAEPGVAEALAMPPRRQPDDEETGVTARFQHALFARPRQQRLRRDAEDPLDGERAVGEQAARVALALLRHGGGAGEAEQRAVGGGEPRAELDRRPVVLRSSERHENRTLLRSVSAGEQSHVARRLLEDRGQLVVGSFDQEPVGRVDEQQFDASSGGEPGQTSPGELDVQAAPATTPPAFERPTGALQPGRRGPQLRRVRHEPRQNQHAPRVHARAARHGELAHRTCDSSVSARRTERSAGSYGTSADGGRRAPGPAGESPAPAPGAPVLGSIPSSSTSARRASW